MPEPLRKTASVGAGQLPTHVAIIMDGNGRWAQKRHLPRTAGHKRGADKVREIVKAAAELGIPYLTLFGFSSENWRRPEAEVADLMSLLRFYLEREVQSLNNNGVCLRIIGDRSRLDSDIVRLIAEAEQQTRGNSRITVTVALSYGARAEITEAARSLAQEVANGRLAPDDITEEMVEQRLFTSDLPDPDLLIRTSGEQRLSNFLLWQLSYTELLFVETLWPDFSQDCFIEAIDAFRNRDRRYGFASA